MGRNTKALIPALFISIIFSFLIFYTISANGACVQPPSNMVSWWRAEGNANDSIGTNHGTLTNGATFASGMVGQSFSFDGVDDYVSVPNGIISSTARNFTVDAWVYPNNITFDGKIVYGGAQSGEYQLFIYNGNYEFGVHLSDGTWYIITASANINTWALVTGIRRGTSIELWVNGILQNSTMIPDLDLYTTNGFNSSIGSYNSGAGAFFSGLIDEVEIFNRALSQSEIQAIYNAGSDGKCTEQTAIPTYTGCGMVLFIILSSIAGIYYLRKTKIHS